MSALLSRTAPLMLVSALCSCASDPWVKIRNDYAGGLYESTHAELTELSDSSDKHVYLVNRGMVSLSLPL